MRKGFTLIELLIVIGILAILATTVTLVLNPAEILKQTRDAQRISDFRVLRGAIDLYLARASAPTLNLGLGAGVCDGPAGSGNGAWRASNNRSLENNLLAVFQPFRAPSSGPDFNNTGILSATIDPINARRIDGDGWVPVPFDLLQDSGSPISKLPLDPNPNILSVLTATGYFYAYQCQGLTYEINANMESVKYSNGGLNDVESKDGGTSACQGTGFASIRCTQDRADTVYEVGNAPGLAL